MLINNAMSFAYDSGTQTLYVGMIKNMETYRQNCLEEFQPLEERRISEKATMYIDNNGKIIYVEIKDAVVQGKKIITTAVLGMMDARQTMLNERRRKELNK